MIYGLALACGFRGSTTGQCETRIVDKSINSTCKFSTSMQFKAALKKHRDVPWPCPMLGCKTSPFILNVRHHFNQNQPCAHICSYDLSVSVLQEHKRVRFATTEPEERHTKGMPPRLIVKKAAQLTAAATVADTSTSNVWADMYGAVQRHDCTNSDWHPQAQDEATSEEEDNHEQLSVDISGEESGNTTTSSWSNSSSSNASSSGTPSSSSSEEVNALEQHKRMTKTRPPNIHKKEGIHKEWQYAKKGHAVVMSLESLMLCAWARPLGPSQIVLNVSPKWLPPKVCEFYRIWVVCTTPRGAKWERRRTVHYLRNPLQEMAAHQKLLIFFPWVGNSVWFMVEYLHVVHRKKAMFTPSARP